MYSKTQIKRIVTASSLLLLVSVTIGSARVVPAANKPQTAQRATAHHTTGATSTKRRTAKFTSAHKAPQAGSYTQLVNQAKSLVDSGKNAAAYNRAMSAVHLVPTRADAYFFAGVAALNQDQFATAEHLVKQAVVLLHPEQTGLSQDCQSVLRAIAQEKEFSAHVAAARHADSLHQPAEAAQEYEAAYTVYPVRADIGVKAAAARLAMKDYDNAKRLLDQVMAGAVNDADRAIAVNLQNKLGDIQEKKDEVARREAELSGLRRTIDSAKDALTQKKQELQTRADSLNTLRAKRDEETSQHDALIMEAAEDDIKRQQCLDAAADAENKAQNARNDAAQAEQAQQAAIAANNSTQAVLYGIQVKAHNVAAQKYDKAAAKDKEVARQWDTRARQAEKRAATQQMDIDTLQNQVRGAEGDIEGLSLDIKKVQADIDKFMAQAQSQQQELDRIKTSL